MNKILLYIIIGVLLLNSILAEQQSLGTFKQNDCVNLIQICANCTYVNISSVLYPDSTKAVGEQHAMDSSDTLYNYTTCNTSKIGTYIVNGHGDIDGIDTVFSYDLYVTQSGSDSNQTRSNLWFLVFIFVFLYGLLIFGMSINDSNMSIISSFGIILAGLYIVAYGIADITNQYSSAIALINICIGAYILIMLSIARLDEGEE